MLSYKFAVCLLAWGGEAQGRPNNSAGLVAKQLSSEGLSPEAAPLNVTRISALKPQSFLQVISSAF